MSGRYSAALIGVLSVSCLTARGRRFGAHTKVSLVWESCRGPNSRCLSLDVPGSTRAPSQLTETHNATRSLPPLPLPSSSPSPSPPPPHPPTHPSTCVNLFDSLCTHTSTSSVHLMPQRSGPKLHPQFHSVGLAPVVLLVPDIADHPPTHRPPPPSPTQSPLVMQRFHSSSDLHLPTHCKSATPQAVASSMPACVSLSSAPVPPAVSVHCSHTTVSFAAKYCTLFNVGCCAPLSAHPSESQVES